MAAEEASEEQSMEEILQSIKKIIADDDGEDNIEVPAPEPEGLDALEAAEEEEIEIATVDETPEPASEPKEAKDDAPAAEEPAAEMELLDDEDFFDINDVISDGTEESAPAEKAAEPAPTPDPEPEPEPAAAEPAPTPEPMPAPEAEEEDVLDLSAFEEDTHEFSELEDSITPQEPATEMATESVDAGALLSEETISKASSALAQLKQPKAAEAKGLHFRSGTTVEDLVLEALRPMMREWLNNELPATVERLVQEEIRRLSNS